MAKSRPSQSRFDWQDWVQPTESVPYCPNPSPRRTSRESSEIYIWPSEAKSVFIFCFIFKPCGMVQQRPRTSLYRPLSLLSGVACLEDRTVHSCLAYACECAVAASQKGAFRASMVKETDLTSLHVGEWGKKETNTTVVLYAMSVPRSLNSFWQKPVRLELSTPHACCHRNCSTPVEHLHAIHAVRSTCSSFASFATHFYEAQEEKPHRTHHR